MQYSLLRACFNRQPARRLARAVTLLVLLTGTAARAQTITGFSPASGAAGSNVVISGSGFTGVTSVRFGELSAVFTVNSSSQITAVVPRAASTQPLNVTTGAGFAATTTDFTVTRSNSLLFGLVGGGFAGVSGGANAAPAVADLDNDGKLDLLVGLADGTINRYEQTAANGTAFTALGALSTGSATIDMGTQAAVAIVDLDGDGLFNLVLGRGDGTVSEYEQTGAGAATFALVTNNLSNIATPTNTVPCMTDLDGDGYLELIVGKGDGIISQSEQNTRNTDSFYRVDTNFNGIQLVGNDAPFCTDLDGNGLIDMLVGVSTGGIYRYEQTTAGGYAVRLMTNSFNGISAGTNAKPCITDIDGDGLLDLLVGRADGTIDRYEQGTGTNAAPTDISLSPASVAENQAAGTTVGALGSTDPNPGNTFTYAFAAGGADNGSFSISGGNLTTNGAFDYETKSSYSVKIRSTDQGGLFFEKTLTIDVTDVAEVPTIASFTPTSGPVGTSVVISGTHFSDAGAATLKFNGTTATALTVNSNTQITASVPTGATTGTLSVTNADGTGTSSSAFTVGTVADLSVALSATPNPVAEDATLTYTLTVSNAGPSTASSLTATLVLPAGAVYVAGSGTG